MVDGRWPAEREAGAGSPWHTIGKFDGKGQLLLQYVRSTLLTDVWRKHRDSTQDVSISFPCASSSYPDRLQLTRSILPLPETAPCGSVQKWVEAKVKEKRILSVEHVATVLPLGKLRSVISSV